MNEIKYYLSVVIDGQLTYLKSFESSAALEDSLNEADETVEKALNELTRCS